MAWRHTRARLRFAATLKFAALATVALQTSITYLSSALSTEPKACSMSHFLRIKVLEWLLKSRVWDFRRLRSTENIFPC